MPAALMKPKHLRCAVLALAAAAPLNAEELRFDNAAQWRQWILPLGIVELTPQGVVRPLPVKADSAPPGSGSSRRIVCPSFDRARSTV